MIGHTLVNHIVNADDLVVLSPCSTGLQQLLTVCSVYGVEHDIKCSASKSVVNVCRTQEDKCSKCPDFNLSDYNLIIASVIRGKYLGHFIAEQMTADEDIYRKKP